MLRELILAALVALPPAWEDRAEVDRHVRLGMIADGIADAALVESWPGAPDELAAALVAIGWHESRYARRIHAGRCGPRECDAVADARGRVVWHRARSPWQVQLSGVVPPALWRAARGITPEATGAGAEAAALALSSARRKCGDRWQPWDVGAVSMYATGRRCRWHRAPERARMIRRILVDWRGIP